MSDLTKHLTSMIDDYSEQAWQHAVLRKAVEALSPVLPADVAEHCKKLRDWETWMALKASAQEAADLLERQAREIKDITTKNNDLWTELNTAYQKSIRDFHLEKAQQRIEELEEKLHWKIVSHIAADERIEQLEEENKDKSQLLASFMSQIKELEAALQENE